jgi:hypothetical protein
MRKTLAAGCLAAVAAGTLAVGASRANDGLVMHEWGTILAMNGSDGAALEGMYQEEHALPGFVHARGREELRLRSSNSKFETPVIYFYSGTTTRVNVEVGFPAGLWTHWYPQADQVGPALVQLGSPPRPRNGRIRWTVDVMPAERGPLPLPETSPDALWNFTRDVDAAYVTATDMTRARSPKETERFIFYRGLGETRLPLDVSAGGSASVSCGGELTEALRHVYVLRIENGKGAFRYLPELRCGAQLHELIPAMDGARDLSAFASSMADDLTSRLVESGLYPKEARAMVNTWRTSYLETDGIRALFVLPQSWTDRFIPMRVTPAPRELVRVMVGRIELLTADRERAAERAISDLSSPDSAIRERAFAALRDEGRFVQPIIRRTLQTTTNDQVRTLCRRLLLTDFVTDIRASLNDSDGRRLVQEPVFARAQLASLLRDIGLNDEAREEGELALEALERMPAPSMADHNSRNTLRALARANEGAGRDKEALKWYGDLVRFGSGFSSRNCSGCHQSAGPRDTSFFPDWWAGRKFGELAMRTGETTRLVEAEEAALSTDPTSLLAQIRLAYLHEARGDSTRAQKIWDILLGGGRLLDSP